VSVILADFLTPQNISPILARIEENLISGRKMPVSGLVVIRYKVNAAGAVAK
jgi:hypothetical protein